MKKQICGLRWDRGSRFIAAFMRLPLLATTMNIHQLVKLTLLLTLTLFAWVVFGQTLDQSYTCATCGDTGSFGFSYLAAQTYTAGITGSLTSVNVEVNGGNGTLTVQIRDVESGVPGSTVLGSAQIPSPNCWACLTAVSFSPPVAQVAGTQYAIVLSDDQNASWIFQLSPYYPGGFPFRSADGGTTWNNMQEVDSWGGFLFQTFVLVPVTKYSCTGFQSPFDVVLSLNKKTNRAIPLDAQLFDSSNNLITPTTLGTAPPPVVNVSYSSVTSTGVDDTSLLDPLGSSSSGNQFNFDSSTGNWWFNLASTPFTASGMYTVKMQSGDTSQYQISPQCSGQFVRQ